MWQEPAQGGQNQTRIRCRCLEESLLGGLSASAWKPAPGWEWGWGAIPCSHRQKQTGSQASTPPALAAFGYWREKNSISSGAPRPFPLTSDHEILYTDASSWISLTYSGWFLLREKDLFSYPLSLHGTAHSEVKEFSGHRHGRGWAAVLAPRPMALPRGTAVENEKHHLRRTDLWCK